MYFADLPSRIMSSDSLEYE